MDDTDYPKKSGGVPKTSEEYTPMYRTVASLGFKTLFLAITDGKSQQILDFVILGEKDKNGNFGMSIKELKERFTKKA